MGSLLPPRFGPRWARQFYANRAHKTCSRNAAGASLFGAAVFIVFGGMGASAPIFKIYSILE